MPRTGLTLAPLVRQLAGLQGRSPADGPNAPTFAERLAPWLAWTDAISLAGALATPAPPRAGGAAPASAAQAQRQQNEREHALREQARRVQAELQQAITRDPVFADPAADALACKAPVLAHQQTLAARVATLRAQARAVLAAASPAGARLAALDAVLETALAPRERQLLLTVPCMLIDRHHAAQRPTLADTAVAAPAPAAPDAAEQSTAGAVLRPLSAGAAPAPGAPGAAGAPAASGAAGAPAVSGAASASTASDPAPAPAPAYGRHVQQALLAELDLRLQPALALIDALPDVHAAPA